MRIFATSDIHGNKSIIEKLCAIDSKVDLILICGDVGGKGYSFRKDFKEASAAQRMDAVYLDTFLKSLPSPSRFILGRTSSNPRFFKCRDTDDTLFSRTSDS